MSALIGSLLQHPQGGQKKSQCRINGSAINSQKQAKQLEKTENTVIIYSAPCRWKVGDLENRKMLHTTHLA